MASFQLALAEVTQQQGEQRDQTDADDRYARTEHPDRHGPAHDPRGQPVRRIARGQGGSGDRTQCELGAQITGRGDHHAAEAHRQPDPGQEIGVVPAVQAGQQTVPVPQSTRWMTAIRQGVRAVLR